MGRAYIPCNYGPIYGVGRKWACRPTILRALPLVGTIQLLKTDAISNYTALQTQFQRRYSKGLTISSNYTFAKALSDAGPT